MGKRRDVLGAGHVDDSTIGVVVGPARDDEDLLEDDGWDDWSRETDPYEAAFAADLLEAEVGDRVAAGLEVRKAGAEIRYIDDRPGVRELRLANDSTVWVVREHYVFITGNDAEILLMGTWTGAAELAERGEVEWTVREPP